MKHDVSAKNLVALARAAAVESADYQQRFAAEDIEARKIVDIMEQFLLVKARVVYGGAAINAHLSPESKFYDPRLYLPDYDFLTPDPLQDCADLIVAFQQEGFDEVEAKFGIHEGTYKVFVNFRAAADITYMPTEIYGRVIREAAVIDGIHYASVDFLRMNIYVELSRPAGNVGRWEKVYERLLLLNAEHPMKVGRCPPVKDKGTTDKDHKRVIKVGTEEGAIFLGEPDETPVLLMSDKPIDLKPLIPTKIEAIGELLPARTEFRNKQGDLIAVVFETVACHSYTTHPDAKNYRIGSLDLLIEIYYAMYFAEITEYKEGRLLCLIRDLIEREQAARVNAVAKGLPAHDVFPLDCVGHQPTMPELKKAHRDRVREKKKDLAGALQIRGSDGLGPRRSRKQRK
jgi:hypothetical protein